MLFTRGVVLSLCAFGFGVAAAQTPQSLNQLRKEAAAKSLAGQAQSDGSGRLELGPIQGSESTPATCPNSVALDFFKHQIAYQRTEGLDPFKGLRWLHADVWQRGPLTAFYVRDKLNEFADSVRMADLFGKSGLRGGGTCPVEKNWRECVEGFAGMEYANNVVGTCPITLDMSTVPAWKPSPDNPTKRRIADELRKEIEAKWPGVQEIILRDFNTNDNLIAMYLKMPDGDHYESCGFQAMSEPHCEGWALFGSSPVSSVRKRIFDMPYRLK
jgi:hypothetical protein